jgi:cytidine deaminase
VSAFDAHALLAEAAAARAQAYAPYSGFPVGAALLASSGVVYRGCNVENASYGLTNCAERVAMQTAVAAGERSFVAIAIDAGTPAATPPCGACRQVLAEFGWGRESDGGAWELQVALPGDPPDVKPLRAYLPHGFGPAYLGES